MTPEYFAYQEYKDYISYKALAKSEKVPEFKKLLEELIGHELMHFEFWKTLSSKKEFRVPWWKIWFLRFVRKVLGLTFTVKLIERNEQEGLNGYNKYLKTTDGDTHEKIKEFIEHEKNHEWALIKQIDEEQVKFTGSIVLGLNDGLIELTGALVGFSFAFSNTLIVAVIGMITGIAASMSMASSAYLQARHEDWRDPKKSALYTGISYIFVVIVLVSPFLFMDDILMALTTMAVSVLIIISALSYYTSVLFGRKFKDQFNEIFTFSVGVAIISFILGIIIRQFSGIEI